MGPDPYRSVRIRSGRESTTSRPGCGFIFSVTPDESRIRAPDGTSLRVLAWRPKAPPTFSVAIVHGQSEHTGRYQWLGTRIAELGGLAYGADMRGEGHSGGRRGHVEHFDEYVRDLKQVMETITPDGPKRGSRLVYGHSTGGLVALLFGLDHGPTMDVRGACISAPLLELAMAVHPLKEAFGRLANFVAPRIPIPGNIPPEDVVEDPQLRRMYASDPDRARTVTPRWFAAMNKARARATRDVRRIEMPMLWFHGTADRINRCETTLRVFESLPRATELDQTFRPIPGGYHETHNGLPTARTEIHDMIVSWLQAHANRSTE